MRKVLITAALLLLATTGVACHTSTEKDALSLPPEWPSEIPVYANLRSTSVIFEARGKIIIGSSTEDPFRLIDTFYTDALKGTAWTLDSREVDENETTLTYRSGKAELKIMARTRSSEFTHFVMEYGSRGLDAWRDDLRIMPQDPEAERIVARVAEAYASISAVRVEAAEETRYYELNSEKYSTDRESCTILFLRDELFHLTTRRDDLTKLVHSDKSGTRYWTAFDGEEMADTALDALDDVSFLPSSLPIPSLLLGEKPDPGTWDLGGLRVLEDEDLGGRMCYRLRGSNSLGGQSTLWIDHENLMILRIDKTTEDDESRTESTIVCIPEFNPAPTEPERTFQVP